jgi:hypothetical protein
VGLNALSKSPYYFWLISIFLYTRLLSV